MVAEQGYTIAENRSYCVIQAQQNESDYILFVDDDMVFPPDTIQKLIEADKDIVGVYSYSRTLPLTPTVAFMENGEFKPHDLIAHFKRPEELFECWAIGFGVALIKMSVFEQLDKPWFSFTAHESGKILVGEDAFFCDQARKKGISIWCEPRLSIGHLGEHNYNDNQ